MTGRTKKQLSFTFNNELIREIDERRGFLPRSTFVELTLTNIFKEGAGCNLRR